MTSQSTTELTTVLQLVFDDKVQQDGIPYAYKRLSELHLERDHACALAQGSRHVYRVQIDLQSTRMGYVLVSECTCPMGDDCYPCKHVWALLLRATATTPTDWSVPAEQVAALVARRDGVFELYPIDEDIDFDDENALYALFEDDDDYSGSWEPPPPTWRDALNQVRLRTAADRLVAPVRSSSPAQLEYVVDEEGAANLLELRVRLFRRSRTKKGLGKAKRFQLSGDEVAQLPHPEDRAICAELFGVTASSESSYYQLSSSTGIALIGPARFADLLPRLCATGRFGYTPERLVGGYERLIPLRWDGDTAHVAQLELARAESGWRPSLSLVRDDDVVSPDEVTAVLCRHLAVVGDRLIRFQRGTGTAEWLAAEHAWRQVDVPESELDGFIAELAAAPSAPRLSLPGDAPWTVIRTPVQPRVRFELPDRHGARIRGSIDFLYGELVADGTTARPFVADHDRRQLVHRDLADERAAVDALAELPARVQANATVAVEARDFVEVVRRLLDLGWLIQAGGKRVRAGSTTAVRVTSGIDWFDVDVAAEFDGDAIGLPALLAAARDGSHFVELGDGSRGLLPQDWLERFGALVAAGQLKGATLRFPQIQAALLDALLAAAPRVDVDATFARAREKLRELDRIRPAREPAGFVGQLRPYQREGLGWLRWLRDMGFGGCLADDMGLGKTIQVLALIAATRDAAVAPSLVVAPRSLTHNWLDEAARFTPELRVVDYSGGGRDALRAHFGDADIVVTTYGVVRRDIVHLADVPFDTIVLDEAQTIKNASSQANKTCRTLRAEHRLALTGTPVENRLSDLGAIFEFINPGMLAKSKLLGSLATARAGESLSVLARALRPFLLRRTKQQVLDDLPDKTEQVIYCKMSKAQRTQYDELRGHYHAILTKRIDDDGLAKAKFQVLEALLRLRQVACHPGLVDKDQHDAPSAKLDALVERVVEVASAGHKVLVFSQFTTLLALARTRLDEAQITYEYLDGRTRNRKQRVDRFQSDADCHAFLISLKAGGHGLNLTAADYVFLLDPWWNPAVEAQAIDRAHRIGQTRSVFAYRLIAEDTVEDKILTLQQHKRELADGILRQDASVLAQLSRDDLTMLLS